MEAVGTVVPTATYLSSLTSKLTFFAVLGNGIVLTS